MFTRLKVIIEPQEYHEFLTLKIEAIHGDKFFAYNQILPTEDHIHSVFDYMWQVAKEEITRAMELEYPLIRKEPSK